MDPQLVALSLIRTASAVCASMLAVFAFRAYRLARANSLLWLGTASALLVTGFLGAGVLYQTTGSLAQASVFEAPFTLAALLTMIASLYAKDRRTSARVMSQGPAP